MQMLIIGQNDNRSKKVNGIIIQNIEGFQYIKAKNFIDCTGDAVLSDICGVECREAGRDTEMIQPASLNGLNTNIDFSRAPGRKRHSELHQEALDAGHFTNHDRHFVGIKRIGNDIWYQNCGHVFNLDALSCRSLSDAGRGARLACPRALRRYESDTTSPQSLQAVEERGF
jgi:hypothetical protein